MRKHPRLGTRRNRFKARPDCKSPRMFIAPTKATAHGFDQAINRSIGSGNGTVGKWLIARGRTRTPKAGFSVSPMRAEALYRFGPGRNCSTTPSRS